MSQPSTSTAQILLLGHGNGKANASHQWVAYVEKHDHTVAAKVVADVRADIDNLTTGEVLARAQHYFGLAPQRYQGRDPGTPAAERARFPQTDNPGPTN